MRGKAYSLKSARPFETGGKIHPYRPSLTKRDKRRQQNISVHMYSRTDLPCVGLAKQVMRSYFHVYLVNSVINFNETVDFQSQ